MLISRSIFSKNYFLYSVCNVCSVKLSFDTGYYIFSNKILDALRLMIWNLPLFFHKAFSWVVLIWKRWQISNNMAQSIQNSVAAFWSPLIFTIEPIFYHFKIWVTGKTKVYLSGINHGPRSQSTWNQKLKRTLTFVSSEHLLTWWACNKDSRHIPPISLA